MIAVGLLGIVSLATEVGTWYLARSAANNAADASAVAAALAVSANSSSSSTPSAEATTTLAQDAGTDVASDNGYTAGLGMMVTTNNPPATGNYTTGTAAAAVLINVSVTPILSSLFSGLAPTITETTNDSYRSSYAPAAGVRPGFRSSDRRYCGEKG